MKLNRSHKRPLEFTVGTADRDPMFAPVWYVGNETLSLPSNTVQTMPNAPGPRWDLAPLPPPDTQQNDHVMRYWSWRLDRMENKRNG